MVSTHASTRDATNEVCADFYESFKFLPTRPHGTRLKLIQQGREMTQFLPTRPHGTRPTKSILLKLSIRCFYPRVHTGRDRR